MVRDSEKPARTAGNPTETLYDVKESREWLRVTLSSIGDGVITTDAKGHCTFLNPVAEKLTGLSSAEAQNLPVDQVFRIVNEETRAAVENPALRALREGLVVGLANHTVLIARDGSEHPIDDSGAPIRNVEGEVAGVVLVFRDISERRAAERSHQHALEYAQGIVATIRESLVILNSDLRVHTANRTFYNTFRVTPEETEGRLVYELGNRQWDIPKLRELLENILPANSHFDDLEVTHEFEMIGTKTMLLNARRVQEGKQLILLAIEDITGRRKAESDLRNSEQRYRRLFQSAKDGIVILDASSGKITDANPYIAALIGLDSRELVGKELWEIGLFRDIDENKAVFTRLQRDGYVQYDHLPLKNVSGETVDVEFVSNVYREDGRLVAQCNVRSIAERRLRDQARAAIEESRRKDEFLAMLSHELRNPLAPIRAAVHVLKASERSRSEDLIQKRAHEVIERQTANLTTIISDLLEVSRVLSGQIRMNFQSLDLKHLMKHVVETVQPSAEQRRHTLTVHECDEPIWVNGDATRLEEIFTNILNNAIKYTHDDGNGSIDVYCEKQAEGSGPYARIRVRDNGGGIEKELLPRVFDLFTQADRSLEHRTGGLGVGLALAQRLVHLHGGTIEAFSPPKGQGNGTEVIVQLPLIDPPIHVEAAPEREPEAPYPGSLRVLIVDDNTDHVMMLAAWLQSRGYAVQSAYDGPTGLHTARQWRPDIILLDIGLPDMDGYTLARHIRSSPEVDLKKATLIAITGYGREHDIDLAREAGFDSHLVKPYEFNELEKLMAVRK